MRAATLHLLQLLYLMAPAYLANMASPFARYWKGWNRPIHASLLGDHKTVVGFALAVATGLLATAIQAWIQAPAAWGEPDRWPWIGLGFGLGVAGGDSLKSLFKRRLGIAAGGRWLPFDQIDFALGALLLVAPWVRVSWGDVLLILAITFVGDLLVNRVSFALGIKQTPW
jgi:CDP-2,3-bis-(O-geranylgeranyl)-sn-glycerol synthase